MRLALVGVGQAGGKVVDALVAYDRRTDSGVVADALAVNTAKADLLGLRHVPKRRQVLIGVTRVKGHGVGADNELGAAIAAEDVGEVLTAIDEVPVHQVDAFLLVAGLGGGTGSGAAPVIARELRRLYDEPVYALGILPAADEGGIYTLNAARSFRTLVDEVDSLLVFDNDAWRRADESVAAGFATINEEIARRLGVLFSAGEARTADGVAESVVDASEIINTLAGGGVATIGYAAVPVDPPQKTLFGRRRPPTIDEGESVTRITSLVRRAALGRLTLPCELGGVDRALVVVSGPPEYLSRKGIERGRKWLEETTGTMEVRGGDYPIPDTGYVGAVVLLSGVYDVPRIGELQRVAVDAQRNVADRGGRSAGRLADLLGGSSEDGTDRLEPLF
jgi:cell division GTPase FtsZ